MSLVLGHILLLQNYRKSQDQSTRHKCHNHPHDVVEGHTEHILALSSWVSKNDHGSSTPRMLPIVHRDHSLKSIKGRRATYVYFLSLQHSDHSIKVCGVDAQVSPAVGPMDEEVEVEHILDHTDHTEVQAVGGVQIRFVVMG